MIFLFIVWFWESVVNVQPDLQVSQHLGDGDSHMTRAAAAEMFFSTGHWRADVCHRHRIFIPPEWIVAYVSVCIHWLSSVHTPRLSCRISIPPPHVGRRLLEVCNHQGWVGGGGAVLLFRGENDELVQEGKQNSIRCHFHQSCFPQSRVSLTVFVAEEDDSLSRRLTQHFFFFSVWKAGQVNLCVSVPCLLCLWNSAEALSPESNPTLRLKISQH